MRCHGIAPDDQFRPVAGEERLRCVLPGDDGQQILGAFDRGAGATFRRSQEQGSPRQARNGGDAPSSDVGFT